MAPSTVRDHPRHDPGAILDRAIDRIRREGALRPGKGRGGDGAIRPRPRRICRRHGLACPRHARKAALKRRLAAEEPPQEGTRDGHDAQDAAPDAATQDPAPFGLDLDFGLPLPDALNTAASIPAPADTVPHPSEARPAPVVAPNLATLPVAQSSQIPGNQPGMAAPIPQAPRNVNQAAPDPMGAFMPFQGQLPSPESFWISMDGKSSSSTPIWALVDPSKPFNCITPLGVKALDLWEHLEPIPPTSLATQISQILPAPAFFVRKVAISKTPQLRRPFDVDIFVLPVEQDFVALLGAPYLDKLSKAGLY